MNQPSYGYGRPNYYQQKKENNYQLTDTDKNEAEKVKIILDVFLKVKSGGVIFVPKNTYQLMSSGRKGIEALIKVLDYNIELPPYYISDMIIASKGT